MAPSQALAQAQFALKRMSGRPAAVIGPEVLPFHERVALPTKPLKPPPRPLPCGVRYMSDWCCMLRPRMVRMSGVPSFLRPVCDADLGVVA